MNSQFKFALLAVAEGVLCLCLVACGGASEDEDLTSNSVQRIEVDSQVVVAGTAASSHEQALAIPEGTWVKVASEYQMFSLATSQTVRFGSGSHWVERTLVGKVYCGISSFRMDPIAGAQKQCQIKNVATVPAAPVTGSATLNWIAPQNNADGSALSDLAGYRIYYGTTSGQYTKVISIASPYTTSYTIQNLSAGTYFATVKAYDTANNESSSSTEVTKTIK
jgi:hypothetical protein